MLKSSNKAAYFTLLREGLSIVLTPVDLLLYPFEKRLLRKKADSNLPVILIMGAARSGTTLLYQLLCDYLPVSYFHNLSTLFPRSSITASKLFNRLLKKSKSDYINYFGNISGFGAPNEGLHIWNRWLGSNRNQIETNLSGKKTEEMRNFLHTWNNTFKRPLINKSNRNSLAINFFEQALPGKCYFLVIERDPVYVVQSLIQSREIIQGDKRIGWGVGATNGSMESGSMNDPLSYIDDICNQVFRVSESLNESLKAIAPERYFKISYEELCENPVSVIQRVHDRIFERKIEDDKFTGLQAFEVTNKQKLSDEEFLRIKERVNKTF